MHSCRPGIFATVVVGEALFELKTDVESPLYRQGKWLEHKIWCLVKKNKNAVGMGNISMQLFSQKP